MTREQAHVILSEVMKEPNMCICVGKLVMVLRCLIEGDFPVVAPPTYEAITENRKNA